MKPEVLKASIAKVNQYTEMKRDPGLGRKPEHLFKFASTGPFYALKGIRAFFLTLGGVRCEREHAGGEQGRRRHPRASTSPRQGTSAACSIRPTTSCSKDRPPASLSHLGAIGRRTHRQDEFEGNDTMKRLFSVILLVAAALVFSPFAGAQQIVSGQEARRRRRDLRELPRHNTPRRWRRD